MVVALPQPDEEDPLFVFEANDPVVTQTSFIPWQTQPAAVGAPPRAALPLSLLLHNFIARSRISPEPADQAAFATISPFECVPNPAFWARLLTEYKASGLFTATYSTPYAFETALRSLIPLDPTRLLLTAADFITAETFDTPPPPAGGVAGRGRGRGRGRGAVAAPPPAAIPGPLPLRFISMANIKGLEQPDNALPLLAWARLAGMLGPAFNRAVRAREASQVQAVASVLAPNINKQLGSIDAPAATLAVNLKDFLLTTQLPAAFRADRQDGTHLQREAQDAFRYRLGSTDERVAVEVRRIFFVKHTCASPAAVPPTHCQLPRQPALYSAHGCPTTTGLKRGNDSLPCPQGKPTRALQLFSPSTSSGDSPQCSPLMRDGMRQPERPEHSVGHRAGHPRAQPRATQPCEPTARAHGSASLHKHVLS